MKYILRVIDFETTGVPDKENKHSVVEAAFIDIDALSKQFICNYVETVKPETFMDIRAQAVHHISYLQALEEGEPWLDVESKIKSHGENETLIYVAHNADFEQKFFNPPDSKWICTYKVGLKLFQDAPGHSNQVLKYYLSLADKPEHHPPHRALPDCRVTAEILFEMSKIVKFNEMIRISKEPPYLIKIGFGKYKGQRFENLPEDYLDWLLKQDDLDEGVKAAANRILLSRKN